jgi:tetratricopeptide (TPR) repeat protein
VSLGRNQEALQQIELAQQLDSSSSSILADKALILYYSGRTQDAVALLKQINETEPTFLSTHRYLALIDLVNKDYPEYLAESRRVAQLSQNRTELAVVNAAEKGFHAGGPQAMFQATLGEEKKLFAEGRLDAYQLAVTCALLGQNQQALDYLRMARGRNESSLSGIAVDPTLASLHSDPSYSEFVSQLGLPPLTVR